MTKLFERVLPTLDGAAVTLDDGVPRLRHLRFNQGDYNTPFIVQLNGDAQQRHVIDTLPRSLVAKAGQVQVLSGGDEPSPSNGVIVFQEDFEAQTAGAHPTGFVVNSSLGSVAVDDTVSYSGTKSCKFTINGPCQPVGTDANVGLEKNLSGLPNYSSTTRGWYVQWWAKHDVGYYDLNCGREFKELYVFRLPGGSSIGACAHIASANGGPLDCPDLYGAAVVPAGTIAWSVVTTAETGSIQPASCSGFTEKLRQHLNTTTTRPIDVDDGNWHRHTFKFVRESALNAGDGVIGIWVDGQKAMLEDGTDPTAPCYQKVWTRTTEYRLIQIFGIVNQGLSATASRWLDNLVVWRDP